MAKPDPLLAFMRDTRRELRALRSRLRAVSDESPPPGVVVLFPKQAVADPPDGWRRPNGQAIDPETDPECFDLYGAFLPDLPAPGPSIDPSDTLRWLVRMG